MLYDAGHRVSVVGTRDALAHLPPRVTLRSGVLRGVADDLDEVAALKVFYTRRPRTLSPDGSGVIELPEPYDELLVLDLAKYLARAAGADTAALEAEEAILMESLDAHVASYAAARVSRSG